MSRDSCKEAGIPQNSFCTMQGGSAGALREQFGFWFLVENNRIVAFFVENQKKNEWNRLSF